MSDQTPPPPPENQPPENQPPQNQPAGPPPDQAAYQPQQPQQAPPGEYAQQAYQQPGPYTMPPQATDPGKTLGIVGLVLSFFTALIGMIISIVAFRSSKKAGFKNTPALAGIIIGAVFTVIGIISIIAAVSIGAAALHNACSQLGPGVHRVNGTTITCS